MRLVLIPDLLSKAAGPIGIGKRGGKIYGYDAKGKPVYAPMTSKEQLHGHTREQAVKAILRHLRGTGAVSSQTGDKVLLTGKLAEVLGRKENAVERLGNLSDRSVGKLLSALKIPDQQKHRGQAGYAERREASAERKLARAAKLELEAKAKRADVQRHMDASMGTPILVGHHSEKRHRRDLDKMHRNFGRAIEAQEQANKLKTAAKNPSSAISADDPEAVVQLKKKIGNLEQQRDAKKKLNKTYKKHKGSWERIQAELGMSDEVVESYKRKMTTLHWQTQPVPGYELTNLGARIRDAKKRIESLAVEAATPEAKPVEGAGWRIHEDHEDNRVWVTFDQKPPREITKNMREQGFKWSPGRGAWIRQLNNAGRYAAERVARSLAKTALPGAVSPTTQEVATPPKLPPPPPKPKPQPLEKKPAKGGQMKRREGAGQLLLLSYTARAQN